MYKDIFDVTGKTFLNGDQSVLAQLKSKQLINLMFVQVNKELKNLSQIKQQGNRYKRSSAIVLNQVQNAILFLKQVEIQVNPQNS